MTDAPAWHQAARDLIASGVPVAQAAREVGMSEHAVRFGLDINNCKARTLERTRRKRALAKLHRQQYDASGYVERVRTPRHHVTSKKLPRPDQVCIKGDTAIAPTLAFVTLPQISLPKIEDEPRVFRLVPKVKVTVNEGAERIRRIHLAMQRRGTFRSVDPAEVRI